MEEQRITKQGELLPKERKRPKYKNSLCNELIELSSQGRSPAVFCSQYNLSRQSYYDWQKRYKDFKIAAEIAEEAYKAFWLETARHAVFKQLDCDNKVLLKMLDIVCGKESKVSNPQSGNININTFNLPTNDLSPEDRREKISQLVNKIKTTTEEFLVQKEPFKEEDV